MKNNDKILIGFSIAVLLVFVQGAVTFNLQNELYDETLMIKDVEVPLEMLTEKLMRFESALSEDTFATYIHWSMKEYADIDHHKQMHIENKGKIDFILDVEAPSLIKLSNRDQEDKEKSLKYLDKAKQKLDELYETETKVFEAIDNDDLDRAYALIMKEGYHENKHEFMEIVENWELLERKITHDISKRTLRKSDNIIHLNLGISIGIVIMITLTLMIVRSAFIMNVSKKKK